MKAHLRNRHHRGAVLLLAALFTFFTLLAAVTLFKVLPVEFNAAQRSRLDVNAHYAADAGVKGAVAWLESQPVGTRLDQSKLEEFNDEFGQRTALGNHWEYEVELERIEAGHFGITSRAYFRDEQIREVKAQVVQQSLGKFAFFIDKWPFFGSANSVGSGTLVYSFREKLLTGPFHTNDFFVLSGQNEGFGGTEAFVSGPYAEMTHARTTDLLGEELEDFIPDGNAYLGPGNAGFNNAATHVPFNEEGAVEQRYQQLVEGGRGNLRKIQRIPFPNVAVDVDGVPLREKARGVGNTQFLNQGILGYGVHVPSSDDFQVLGGVYVVGDAAITLQTDANGNQIQSIAQAHREEAYFEASTEQIVVPRLVARETDEEPLFLDQVVYDTVTQRRIVGYEDPIVTTDGDGITVTVEVPIYEEIEVQVPRIVQVPFDDVPNPPPPPYIEYVEDMDNPVVYDTIVLNPIDEDDYDPQNPDHQVRLQDAGDRVYQVIEVTADEGYALPAGATVEGVVTSGIVPKDHTVFVDAAEGVTYVSAGNLNGVTFVDGNVTGLRGVNRGAVTAGRDGRVKTAGRTIAAAPEFGREIEISGDLLQHYDQGGTLQGPNQTLTRGELPPNAAHALGLVAREVNLKPTFQTGDSRPLDLYAVILAGWGQMDDEGRPVDIGGRQRVDGGFGTDEELLNGQIALRRGRFRLFGGIITAEARPWYLENRGLEGELTYDPAAAYGLGNFPSINSVRLVRYSEYVTR